jgi:hypothetical protein
LGACEIVWVAERFGAVEALRATIEQGGFGPVWRLPFEAVLDHNYERAAELFAELDYIDEGYARLKAGEQHLARGRSAEGRRQLELALTFYRRLGATRYVARAERLLEAAGLEIPA